jgi:hypothetical protein
MSLILGEEYLHNCLVPRDILLNMTFSFYSNLGALVLDRVVRCFSQSSLFSGPASCSNWRWLNFPMDGTRHPWLCNVGNVKLRTVVLVRLVIGLLGHWWSCTRGFLHVAVSHVCIRLILVEG